MNKDEEVDQVETARLNIVVEDIRELLMLEEDEVSVGLLGAVLLSKVMTMAEGDVTLARDLLGDVLAGLRQTIDESEGQIAALRQGGLN